MPLIDGQKVTVEHAGGFVGGTATVGGSTSSASAIGDNTNSSFFSSFGNFFKGDCSLWKIISIAAVALLILKRR